jgi:hypothetical protein
MVQMFVRLTNKGLGHEAVWGSGGADPHIETRG